MRNFVLLSLSWAFLLTFCFSSQAQIRIAPRIGTNLNYMSYSGESAGVDLGGARAGFIMGVQGDIPVFKQYTLRPGIFYSSRGDSYFFSNSEFGSFYIIEGKTILNYLEIPVLLNRSFPVGKRKKGWMIDVQAGPYLGIALSGKNKTDNSSRDFEFGSNEMEDDYRATDFGLSLGYGVEYKQFSLSMNYNLGLRNVVTVPDDSDYKERNRSLTFTLGYFLPVTPKKTTK